MSTWTSPRSCGGYATWRPAPGASDCSPRWSPTNTSFQPYYYFCYLYAQKFKPKVWVELGLELGRCTAFVAHGSPETRCIGVEMLGPDNHGMSTIDQPFVPCSAVSIFSFSINSNTHRTPIASVSSKHTIEPGVIIGRM